MNSSIVITGATGFIGRYLLMNLLSKGYSVCTIIRSEGKKTELTQFLKTNDVNISKLSFVISDLNDLSVDMFENNVFDAWFHLAWAGVNREQVESEVVQSQNVEFSKKCLHCARNIGCTFFGDFGSRAEYPADIDVIEEIMPKSSLNKYGEKKKEFYEYAYRFCKDANIKYLHYRVFSVVGPGDHPWSLVMTACKNFRNNESMEFGACTQMWNYIDVRDLSELVIKVFERIKEGAAIRDFKGIVNVAGRESRRLIDYVREIHKVCGSTAKMTFGTKAGFASKPILATIEMLEIRHSEIPFRDTILNILNSIEEDI